MRPVTVYPGSEPPPPDRFVGRMPAGWKPTPLTPRQRAANCRRFAAEAREKAARADEEEATRWDRRGPDKAGNMLRARADQYDRQADQYEQMAELLEASPPPEPPVERPPTRTFVIGG